MKNKDCPICGEKNSLEIKKEKLKIKYAREKGLATFKYYECPSCGATFDFDFEEENEKSIKREKTIVRQKSVSKILSCLEKDYSFVEIERSFGLPPRSLSKWKTGAKSPSAAVATLINLIGVFPWLSYVAASDYDLDFSYRIAAMAFLRREKELGNYVNFSSDDYYNVLTLAAKKSHVSVIKKHDLLNLTTLNSISEPQYSFK